MKIKSYIEFIKESSGKHEFGCAMLKIPFRDWNEITSQINKEDVYDQMELTLLKIFHI